MEIAQVEREKMQFNQRRDELRAEAKEAQRRDQVREGTSPARPNTPFVLLLCMFTEIAMRSYPPETGTGAMPILAHSR